MSDASPPPPPPHFAPPTVAGALPPSSATPTLAVFSMVLGICAVVGSIFGVLCLMSPLAAVPAIAAITIGWVSLAKRKPGRGFAWTGVITGVVALLIAAAVTAFWVYAFSAGNHYPTAIRVSMSQSQARQIGLALQMYASDNKGALPPAGPGWETALAENVTSDLLTSPNAQGAAPGTPSYIYVPVASLSGADPGRVILYENPSLKATRYAVVYADGRSTSVTKEELDAIIAALPKDPAAPR